MAGKFSTPQSNIETIKQLFGVEKNQEINRIIGKALEWGLANISDVEILDSITYPYNKFKQNRKCFSPYCSLETHKKFDDKYQEISAKKKCSQSRFITIFIEKYLDYIQKSFTKENDEITMRDRVNDNIEPNNEVMSIVLSNYYQKYI